MYPGYDVQIHLTACCNLNSAVLFACFFILGGESFSLRSLGWGGLSHPSSKGKSKVYVECLLFRPARKFQTIYPWINCEIQSATVAIEVYATLNG